MEQILIYTEHTSSRLRYIFDLLITDLCGLEYRLTHHKDEFNAYTGAKFSYAAKPLGNEVFFESASVLFEADIKHQPLDFCEMKGGLRGFYPVGEESAMPFDPFATSFLFVTLYTEYLPGKYDKHERYRASQSMNYVLGQLDKPLVNYYALAIQKILKERYPDVPVKRKPFRYVATFDVDIAYAYLHRGLKRTLGGIARSFVFSEFREIRERFAVISGKKADPYDTYDYVLDTCEQYNVPAKFFFMVGNESHLDKNIPHDTPAFRALVKRIDDKAGTGVHLSYKSHVASVRMKEEVERLEEITGKPVVSNRFHYLRFQVPNTYLRINKLGIKEDYSMGYAPHIGFRAAICTPYYLFNLKTNEVTGLQIFPFAFMDVTFTQYYRNTTEEAMEKINRLMGYVKETGGDLVGIWHNSSFTERGEWKGWRELFENVAQRASAIMKQETGA